MRILQGSSSRIAHTYVYQKQLANFGVFDRQAAIGEPMSENDPEVIYSDLCGVFRRDGIEVRVLIFQLEEKSDWSLWVTNGVGGFFVWEHVYKTDLDAFDEFQRFVREEGMSLSSKEGNIVPFPRR